MESSNCPTDLKCLELQSGESIQGFSFISTAGYSDIEMQFNVRAVNGGMCYYSSFLDDGIWTSDWATYESMNNDPTTIIHPLRSEYSDSSVLIFLQNTGTTGYCYISHLALTGMQMTDSPTMMPTPKPSVSPTSAPTNPPTISPSVSPTNAPTTTTYEREDIFYDPMTSWSTFLSNWVYEEDPYLVADDVGCPSEATCIDMVTRKTDIWRNESTLGYSDIEVSFDLHTSESAQCELWLHTTNNPNSWIQTTTHTDVDPAETITVALSAEYEDATLIGINFYKSNSGMTCIVSTL